MIHTPRHNRRLFLRGLGGAAVAAPFLSSVAERAAKGAGEVFQAPKRLIVMFTHYGCLTDRWFPVKSHGELTVEDLVGTSLESLAPHVNKLLIPRGLRVMNEWTTDLSLGQGNDTNTQVVGSYFTCVPVSPHSDEAFNFDIEKKFNAKPTAPSLDHVCAQQLNASGLPLFLHVGEVTDSTQSAISYSEPLVAYPGVTLSRALSDLTGLFSSEEVSPDTYAVVRKNSVIDMVRADLETLERFDMSASDRLKLEEWKELLHHTTAAAVSQLCGPELATSLGLTDANVGAAIADGYDRLTNPITAELDGADLYSNLAVLAALCDVNRVIFLKYPPNFVFRGLGLTLETHSLSQRTGSANMAGRCVAGVNDLIQTVDRYYAQKFTHLVSQLDAIEEGDGTLLDNTATVWFQQFSDGCACNCNNMPIIQAGGCGGYFKTGVTINVDDGSPNLSRGNSSPPCEEDGEIFLETFKVCGTPPELANAPINKFYCNLMNAIGVKAGADGFPLVGGTEPVTHYGMYDDTRDFASGGANPPKINDPGEYEELRA